MSPHHQGHWVLQGPAPESREVAQHIEQRPQPGLIPAQVEDQGQDDARVGVVRVQNVDGQHPEEEPPPLPLLHAVDGQQAEKQSDKDVPAGELFPEVVGMEGQDEEGLGDHRKERQPPQIPPDVPCVHQANCQAVAENREGQPSYPPEFRVLGEKGSRLAVSDAGVAILFAQAALEGASLNIFINTKMMKDQEEAERLNYLADQLIATGKELKETTYDAVLKGIRP